MSLLYLFVFTITLHAVVDSSKKEATGSVVFNYNPTTYPNALATKKLNSLSEKITLNQTKNTEANTKEPERNITIPQNKTNDEKITIEDPIITEPPPVTTTSTTGSSSSATSGAQNNQPAGEHSLSDLII